MSLAAQAAEIAVPIVYLEQQVEQPPTLSNLDSLPDDLGLAGAELGIKDNKTTGAFLGHKYSLESIVVEPGGDLSAAVKRAASMSKLIVVNAPADVMLRIADMVETKNALLFNAASQVDDLRNTDCRANVLHTMPSHAMRADALAQFLKKKRWTKLALITGSKPSDMAFGNAIRRSGTKFQLKIVDDRTWEYNADIRRNAAQEVPLYTQKLAEHDVLVVADEVHDFGRYFKYNTWEPKLIAGSEGLAPMTWSPVVEQWGAVQLQNRFKKSAERGMLSVDYGAWAAVRTVGEAVTRAKTADADALRAFILSDKFKLGGHKGRPMNYRAWNGQLRQTIPLVHPRAVVAMAPLEGYLHQRTELDTLGLDKPESACKAFAANN